jgi:hypothetical protein
MKAAEAAQALGIKATFLDEDQMGQRRVPRAFLRCQLLAHRPSRPNRRVSGAG